MADTLKYANADGTGSVVPQGGVAGTVVDPSYSKSNDPYSPETTPQTYNGYVSTGVNSGRSIASLSNPNPSMGVPPPPLTAKVTPGPQGTMKAPAVVTSQQASDHVDSMGNFANTALTDTQNMASYNTASRAAADQADMAAQQNQSDTGNTGNTGVDSMLSSMGFGNDGGQQAGVVSQDEAAIAADQQMQAQVDNSLSSMEAGTFPLSAAEQAQVNSLRDSYKSTLDAAETYAKNVQAGMTVSVASSGLQMFSPQMALGEIQRAITLGQGKIAQVNNEIVSSTSKLTQALQDADYKAATRLYDKIGADITLRSNEIDKINTKVFDVQKLLLDYNFKAGQAFDTTKSNILDSLSKNNAPASVRSAVANATSVNDAYNAAGDYLQTATGDQGAYLFAKREAQSAGVTPPDYTTWKAALDQSALNSKLSEYRAEQGIKFNYDVALEKAKTDMANAPTPNYNGEFAATVKLAAQAGGTNTQRNQIKGDLEGFISQGDYGSAYTSILSSASAKLTGANASNFQQQQQSYGALTQIKDALTKLKNSGYDTNALTGGVDAIQTKIGILITDPQYAQAATELNSAFQQYRVNMTGAAFGPAESAEYASVLPGSGNTFALNMAKIDGAQSYLNGQVETVIKDTVGQGGIYIKQYAEAAQNTSQQQQTKQDKLTTFRAADPKNEAMVQEIHTAFPSLTLDQITEQLGL